MVCLISRSLLPPLLRPPQVEKTFIREYNQLCSRESEKRKARRTGCVGFPSKKVRLGEN